MAYYFYNMLFMSIIPKETSITTGKNANLRKANATKKDEFYTQYEDIQKELNHYSEHFRDKIVFCNCDDPYESNFFQYFALNFKKLWLQKLIAMGYNTSPIINTQLPLFEVENIEEPRKKAYKIEINDIEDMNGDGRLDMNDIKILAKQNKDKIKIRSLKKDGDFRSSESIKCLEECDIVVTNPPFSLFREYVDQLVKYNKKFLIIWNQNAITYKEIFSLIVENKIWLGTTSNQTFIYKTPYENDSEKNKEMVRRKWFDWEKWFIAVPAINWYTNLEHSKRNEELILHKKYKSENYPKYDHYDAINVDKVDEIPMDYAGEMWVPITFLGKYNPEQFEIIEWLNRYTILDKKWLNTWAKNNKIHFTAIGGNSKYFRIIIKNKTIQ